MAEGVEKNVFDVIMSSILASMAFLYAWITRLTVGANKTSISVATILEAIKNLSKEVAEMKKDSTIIRNDIDTVKKCTADQKEMYVATENERKRLAKELTESRIKFIKLQ